jgi:preprotein translocase subunit SecF
MELVLLVIAVVAVGGVIWYTNRDKGLDVNGDGKIDISDAKAAVKNTVESVKTTADAKVEVAKVAVKAAATKTKTTTKKAATKAKETVKKTVSGKGRRPKAK